ncbi:lysozyme inhibitor LprI family protein [Geminocystis herdmanii]|uniref:lysozyme inhibitor LprI family protein n=1 Tax=Geminocystis herdmanii TaxID=669359 RepID=UPI000347AB28|nr:lysozyme inhibitor LprI family protein [Geminocystis herdmanii]
MNKIFGFAFCTCLTLMIPLDSLIVRSRSGAARSRDIPPEDQDWYGFMETEDTNLGMKIKGGEAMEVLNQRLNEIITKMNLSLDSEAQNLLRESQSTWVNYAQKKCEFMSDKYRGGTHQGLAYSYCFIGEQVNRIKELIAIENDRDNF